MTGSQQLLVEYAKSGSESAFREVVTRYFGLVYSTALRLVGGDTHLAEDVAQTVFSDLARNAHTLPSGVMLGGWLHQRTYNVAAPMMRAQRRRQSREREAAQMNALQDDPGADLAQVAPVLDEAIMSLGTEDRTAIMLCFFERRDFRSIGQALGSSEDAARMRVTRALDKLHTLLTHRGVTLSAAALGTALATEAVTAASAGLAGSVAAAALASVAAGAGITATLVKLITMTKLKTALIVAAIAALLTPTLLQRGALERLREENARLANELAARAAAAPTGSAVPDQASNRLLAQQSELLRLRAEVTRLRQQQAVRSAANTKEGPSKAVPLTPTEASASDMGTNDFSSEVQARVIFGETVVTGGWATSSGKRALVFVRPELKDQSDGTQTIVIKTHAVELAEGTLAQYGLQDLATTSPQTQQHGVTYANAAADKLRQGILGEPGSQLLNAPNIETSSDMAADLFADTKDENIQLSVTPTLIPGASGIDLKLGVQIRPPKHGD
jgi:RNA polymerase sigma factor (sigma-70 family)